jgi:hypothetical protein
MLSYERSMEHEKVDHEEVWSAIRYLDPDERDKDRKARSATITAALALLLTVCTVWVVLWLRTLRTVNSSVHGEQSDC